jgi:hypothetical protein
LEEHAKTIRNHHLRDLLQDVNRSYAMTAEHNGVVLDYSRQNGTMETMVNISSFSLDHVILHPIFYPGHAF